MDLSNLWNHFSTNTILWVIFLCSIIGISIFFERLWALYQSDTDSDALLIALRPHIEEGNLVEAIQICDRHPGAVSQVVQAGLMRHHRPQAHIEQAMALEGNIQIASLEKNAKVLSLIAHIAPLIGLLGTVVGFIQAFSEMKRSGLVDISANHIGEAMEYALVTTAAGLVVAIPAVVSYNYLVSRIETFALEMQTAAAEVVDLLLSRNNEL